MPRNPAQFSTQFFIDDFGSKTSYRLLFKDIGIAGAKSLSQALSTNSTLTTLDCDGNMIGNEGSVFLAGALTRNSTLVRLRLSINGIGNEGAIALGEALKSNSALKALDVGGNRIENAGAIALAEALKINSTLTTLELSCNDIEIEGANALAEAMKINSGLTTLNFNKRGPETAFPAAVALCEENLAVNRDPKQCDPKRNYQYQLQKQQQDLLQAQEDRLDGDGWVRDRKRMNVDFEDNDVTDEDIVQGKRVRTDADDSILQDPSIKPVAGTSASKLKKKCPTTEIKKEMGNVTNRSAMCRAFDVKLPKALPAKGTPEDKLTKSQLKCMRNLLQDITRKAAEFIYPANPDLLIAEEKNVLLSNCLKVQHDAKKGSIEKRVIRSVLASSYKVRELNDECVKINAVEGTKYVIGKHSLNRAKTDFQTISNKNQIEILPTYRARFDEDIVKEAVLFIISLENVIHLRGEEITFFVSGEEHQFPALIQRWGSLNDFFQKYRENIHFKYCQKIDHSQCLKKKKKPTKPNADVDDDINSSNNHIHSSSNYDNMNSNIINNNNVNMISNNSNNSNYSSMNSNIISNNNMGYYNIGQNNNDIHNNHNNININNNLNNLHNNNHLNNLNNLNNNNHNNNNNNNHYGTHADHPDPVDTNPLNMLGKTTFRSIVHELTVDVNADEKEKDTYIAQSELKNVHRKWKSLAPTKKKKKNDSNPGTRNAVNFAKKFALEIYNNVEN